MLLTYLYLQAMGMTDPRTTSGAAKHYVLAIPYEGVAGSLSFTVDGTHKETKVGNFKTTIEGENILAGAKQVADFYDMCKRICDSGCTVVRILQQYNQSPCNREGTMVLLLVAVQYGSYMQLGDLIKEWNITPAERATLRDHAIACGYTDDDAIMRTIKKFHPIEGTVYVSTDDKITTHMVETNGAKLTYKVTFDPKLDLALTVSGHHEQSIHTCWCIMTALRLVVDGVAPCHIEEINAVTRPVYDAVKEWRQLTSVQTVPVPAPTSIPTPASASTSVNEPTQNIHPPTDSATFDLVYEHTTYKVVFTYMHGSVKYSFATGGSYGLETFIQKMLSGKFEVSYVTEGLKQWYALAVWLGQNTLADKLRFRRFEFDNVTVSIDRANVNEYIVSSARTDEFAFTLRQVVENKWQVCSCPIHATSTRDTFHQMHVWLHGERHLPLQMSSNNINNLIHDRRRWY